MEREHDGDLREEIVMLNIQTYIAAIKARISDRRAEMEWAGNVPGINDAMQFVNAGENRIRRLERQLNEAAHTGDSSKITEATTGILDFAAEMKLDEDELSHLEASL